MTGRSQFVSVGVRRRNARLTALREAVRVVLENLAGEATDRLIELLGKRDAAPMIRRLEAQVTAIDMGHTLDGMAISVSDAHAGVYLLPVPRNPRVIIDDTFATRDLVFAMNRSPRSWVLVLAEQPTRLFEGVRETLVEVRGGGFPMEHTGPGGRSRRSTRRSVRSASPRGWARPGAGPRRGAARSCSSSGTTTRPPASPRPRASCTSSTPMTRAPTWQPPSTSIGPTVHGLLRAMKVAVDKVGRLLIPRPLRERIGLSGGGTVEIDIDGTGLRIRPVAGNELREEGDLLVIPRTGVSIDDTSARALIDADGYRG